MSLTSEGMGAADLALSWEETMALVATVLGG